MEIKKADSKGRVTGFDRDGYYSLVRTADGTLIMRPLEPDTDIDIPYPANTNVLDYLKSLGVETNRVSVDGISRTGYDRMLGGGHRTREAWPAGFDFDEFISKVYGH